MKIYHIAAINLGSTSTKIACYENERCVANENIPHPAEDIARYKTIWDQYEFRKSAIEKYFFDKDIDVASLDAFVTRGGHTKPLTSGVYRITEEMLRQSAGGEYGVHATDLGLKIVYSLAGENTLPLTVDPPSTDEFEPLARYSGMAEIERQSRFHALNQKAVARKYAQDIGRDYEELNLIVVHMGGGCSVAAHRRGKMVDANNALDGDGPFSTNRTGGLPVGALVDLCFSGRYTREDVHKKLNGNGGMMSYLGESDALAVERRAAGGEERAEEVLQAMCYQTAKEIGARATVLCGDVDAIIFTGGMANSKYLVESISRRVRFIAPVAAYPGEFEMESLCLNAHRALTGKEEIREI